MDTFDWVLIISFLFVLLLFVGLIIAQIMLHRRRTAEWKSEVVAQNEAILKVVLGDPGYKLGDSSETIDKRRAENGYTKPDQKAIAEALEKYHQYVEEYNKKYN